MSARSKLDANIPYMRIEACQQLKLKGMTDQQIMDVVNLQRDERLWERVLDHFITNPDCSDEEIARDLAMILDEVHGAPILTAGARVDHHVVVDQLFEKEEYGSKAGVYNALRYVDGDRDWDSCYDQQWSNQLVERDIVKAASLARDAYGLEYLLEREFEEQSKVGRAREIVSVADQIMAIAQKGGSVPHYDGDVNYQGFGRLYGAGRVPIKLHYPTCTPTIHLPANIAQVDEPLGHHYIYVETLEQISSLRSQGHTKFASLGRPYVGGCVEDLVGGFLTAVYPAAGVEAPVDDVASRAAAVRARLQRMKAEQETAQVKPVEEEVEAKVVEAQPEEKAEEAPVATIAAPPLAVRLYNLVKAGPSKSYYLAEPNRKKFMRFRQGLNRDLKAAIKMNEAPAPGAKPVEQLPKPTTKKVAVEGDIDYGALATVVRLRTSRGALYNSGQCTDEDLDTYDNYVKGSGKSTVQRSIRTSTGSHCTDHGMAQAIHISVKMRVADPTIGLLKLTASAVASMYSVKQGGFVAMA